MTDPRIQNLVSIKDPSPTGRTRFAGAWRGNTDGPLHGIVRETVRAAEGLLTNAHDIRGNRNFGPVEAGTRLREAAGPALKVLDGAASKLRSLKSNLRQQVQALDPVRSYEKCGHWQAGFDLRLIDWFHALPTGERAALEHQMRLNPAARLDVAEALLRVPREIAGLDEGVRAEIRHGLQRTMRHADYEAIDTQIDQLQVAESALRHGIEAARETCGNVNDLIEFAPEAFAFSTSAEDAVPVRWTPPATEAVPLVLDGGASDAGPAMPRADRTLKDTRGSLGGKPGRPRAAIPADAAKRIEALAGAGYSLIGIASKLGTTRGTLSQWLDNDPVLKEAFEAGREHERHTLHNVLFTLATEKNNPIAAMFLLKARHGYREGDQGEQANRVSITFALPGAMRPEQFTIEQESTNDRSPENLALPRTSLGRS